MSTPIRSTGASPTARTSNSSSLTRFLVFHAPGYTCGNWHDPLDEDEMIKVRTLLEPLITKYNVQITFGAHNHVYCRYDVNGVQHLTLGGGGAWLYNVTDFKLPNSMLMCG
eukprot:RCo021893